ncbi:hypothetical protein AGLY_016949 [Aphis glycines]|uniref:Uncharacterized protein n=1 Tax=Aphis glycines TaxID=307491 RepID=A0A6G0SWC7_APHGL|nr:hypothetical protein AGLY_016949 [Aphis glycines]
MVLSYLRTSSASALPNIQCSAELPDSKDLLTLLSCSANCLSTIISFPNSIQLLLHNLALSTISYCNPGLSLVDFSFFPSRMWTDEKYLQQYGIIIAYLTRYATAASTKYRHRSDVREVGPPNDLQVFASLFFEFASPNIHRESKKLKVGPTSRSPPTLTQNFEIDIKRKLTISKICKLLGRLVRAFKVLKLAHPSGHRTFKEVSNESSRLATNICMSLWQQPLAFIKKSELKKNTNLKINSKVEKINLNQQLLKNIIDSNILCIPNKKQTDVRWSDNFVVLYSSAYSVVYAIWSIIVGEDFVLSSQFSHLICSTALGFSVSSNAHQMCYHKSVCLQGSEKLLSTEADVAVLYGELKNCLITLDHNGKSLHILKIFVQKSDERFHTLKNYDYLPDKELFKKLTVMPSQNARAIAPKSAIEKSVTVSCGANTPSFNHDCSHE